LMFNMKDSSRVKNDHHLVLPMLLREVHDTPTSLPHLRAWSRACKEHAPHTTFDNQYGNKKKKHKVPKYKLNISLSAHPLHTPRITSETTLSFSPLSGSLELGSSAPNANNFLSISIPPQSKQGRGHLPGPGYQYRRTGLLMPGQRLQGGKGDSRDTNNFVTSCPLGMFFLQGFLCRKGLSSLHAIRTVNVYGSGRRG